MSGAQQWETVDIPPPPPPTTTQLRQTAAGVTNAAARHERTGITNAAALPPTHDNAVDANGFRTVQFTDRPPTLPSNSTLFLPQQIQEFGAQVDGFFAENDALKKQGPLGSLLARHRGRAIKLALCMMLLGFLPLLYVFGSALSMSLRTVAAGVDYLREPDRVVLPSGTVVHSVRQVSDVYSSDGQLLLALSELKNRQPLSAEQVARGYLEWHTAYDGRKHNYTLDAAAKTVDAVCSKLHAVRLAAPCACYLYFGVPDNIVFIRATKEVLYEPSVVHETPAKNGTRYGPSAGTLAERARYVLRRTEFVDTAESALVHYITARGLKKQRRVAQPELACIKECAAFFDTQQT